MNCANCGKPIAGGASFCTNCGAPTQPPAAASFQAPPQPNQVPPSSPPGYVLPPRPPKRNRIGIILGLVAVAVIVLAAAGVGLYFGLRGGGDDQVLVGQDVSQESGEIFLEAAGSAGSDSFAGEAFVPTTPSSTPEIFVTTTIPVGPATTSAPATGGVVQIASLSGDTPALYGGSKNKQLVDKKGQLDFFENNPKKAAAFCAALNADPTFKWSGGTQIRPSQLRDYFAELTPMMLTRDTRVTNHGFKDGKPTPRQSVLQKGQMVLVDRYGVPRVRCECGNPLTPPRAVKKTPKYTGSKWPGFDPASIVVIQSTTVVINTFVVIDINTGNNFDLPAATEGTAGTGQEGSGDTTVPGGEPVVLFDNGNIGGVSPGATAPSFDLATTTLITKIVTYHYVAGGLPRAGRIGLEGEDGKKYGPWDAVGTDGQGGVANASWTVTPEGLLLPPGRYKVVDSDPSTFSANAQSGGVGMTQVYGIPQK